MLGTVIDTQITKANHPLSLPPGANSKVEGRRLGVITQGLLT